MKIGNRKIGVEIGKPKETFIIAEIGINHNGSMEIAKQLIGAAKGAGVDAVKIQRRTLPDAIPLHMRDRKRDTPWGRISYLDYKRRLEFNGDQINELANDARRLGLFFGASIWDVAGAHEAEEELDLDFLKIPSAHMSNEKLVKAVMRRNMPFFFSTGMHDFEAINKTTRWLKEYSNDNWGVFHCNSTYPSPIEELNLNVIPVWKKMLIFRGYPVGYSGHEVGLATTVAAATLGADMIERHITLDRAMWGSDQAASVEPQGFRRLVRDIRSIERAMGNGQKIVNPSEEEKRASLSLT